jgi:hypothetical protein
MALQVHTRFQSVAGTPGYSRISKVSPVSRRANVRVRVAEITSEAQWEQEVLKVRMHVYVSNCLRHCSFRVLVGALLHSYVKCIPGCS